MAKVMIYGNSVDVYQAVTDEQAEQVVQFMIDHGILVAGPE